MAKKTTLKPIELGYRAVNTTGEYTKLMGVLKGMSISQDTADQTTIDAEFFDSPFDIQYTGKPIVLTFDLVNYDLSELPPIFGGTYTPATSNTPESYEGATSAYSSEWEWELKFQKGYKSLVVYKGQTVGTLKKDADGALGYSVTITSLISITGEGSSQKEQMYKIVGDVEA